MVITGWRAVVWLLVALLVVASLLAAVVWLAVLAAVIALVVWFNLLLFPRLAARLRVPQLVAAIGLLAAFVVGGLLLAGLNGVGAGCAAWLIGVAVPQVVLWRLRESLHSRLSRPERTREIDVAFRYPG
jgi:hypothetical protein